uniref:Uncharacterized protein n=1 Tax=Knipowitschia caucasica TaxID=637954 RepID=A0AAV2K6T8_KNICA
MYLLLHERFPEGGGGARGDREELPDSCPHNSCSWSKEASGPGTTPRATRYSRTGLPSLEARRALFRTVEGPGDGAKSGGKLGADMAGVCSGASEGEIPAPHQRGQLLYVHARLMYS